MTNKILFISHYSGHYGSNMSMDSVVRYIKAQGNDVSVLFPSKDILYDQMKNDGIEVHWFWFIYEVFYVKFQRKYILLPLLWMYDLVAFPFLLIKVLFINPDVVYTNSSCNAFGLWIARILGKKHIQHIREFMKEDFGAYYILGERAKLMHFSNSDKIIYVSKAVADHVTNGICKNGIVIYNGVKNPETIKDIKTYGEDLSIGLVGYPDKSKQQHLAIEYMREITKLYPRIKLKLIGDRPTPYKKILKKKTAEYNLVNSVIFVGHVDGVDNIYSKFDVLLMCSRMEAFGRVTVEAMRRRVPVIGFDSAGTSELIIDGVTGYKFRSCQGVITALNSIINDTQKTNEIVENAKSYADHYFNENDYAEKVYNYIMKE